MHMEFDDVHNPYEDMLVYFINIFNYQNFPANIFFSDEIRPKMS